MKRCIDCYKFGPDCKKMATKEKDDCDGFRKIHRNITKLDKKDGDCFEFSRLEVTNDDVSDE